MGSRGSRTTAISRSWRCRGASRSDVFSDPLAVTSPLLLFTGVEDDLDVTGSLSDRSRATLRRRHEAAERRTFVHNRVTDVERVDIDGLIPLSRLELGVRDGGVENLRDLHRRMLLRE